MKMPKKQIVKSILMVNLNQFYLEANSKTSQSHKKYLIKKMKNHNKSNHRMKILLLALLIYHLTLKTIKIANPQLAIIIVIAIILIF